MPKSRLIASSVRHFLSQRHHIPPISVSPIKEKGPEVTLAQLFWSRFFALRGGTALLCSQPVFLDEPPPGGRVNLEKRYAVLLRGISGSLGFWSCQKLETSRRTSSTK